MKRLCLFLLVTALSVPLAPSLQAQSPQQLFQQALSKERAEGKLDEAIQLYQRVLAEAGADRALAARALLQIGRCHEKLGEAAARAAYERLLRDFPDQAAAAEARTRLAALAPTPAAAPAAATTRVLPRIGVGDLQAISPDGSKLVVGDYSKGQNLAVHDLITQQTHPITDFDWTNHWAWGAAWSPDGRQVAYTQAPWKSGTTAELRVASLSGESRTIFRNDAAPGRGVLAAGWLPDGTAILAAVERPDKTTTIGLVAVADGRFTPLKSFSWGFRPDDLPRLSRDGRFIAFVERGAGPADIHVLSVDGRQTHRVTAHPAEDREPVWAPDGRHLAFISNRFGADALWAVAMDDGQPRGEAFKIKDGMHGVDLLDWTPGGIAAVQFLRSWDVFTVGADAATGRTTGAPTALPYARTGRNVSPAWSPDGKALAFVSSASSDPGSRYVVVMPVGAAPREFLIPASLYDFPQAPYDLRWFGNGKGLGFSGLDAKGEAVAFRLTLETGEWRTFPIPVKSWTRIAWNADGTAFYYARQNFAEPGGGIFERSVDGDAERRLYTQPEGSGSTRSPEVSPDGRWLALQQNTLLEPATERIDIVVVHVASGDSRTLLSVTSRISDDAPWLALSGWAPGGRVLVQRKPGGEAPVEWLLLPVDGGAPHPIALDIPPSPGGSGMPTAWPLASWSPDGSRLVFVQTSSESRAFIIEHPLAGLGASTTSAQSR